LGTDIKIDSFDVLQNERSSNFVKNVCQLFQNFHESTFCKKDNNTKAGVRLRDCDVGTR